MTPNANHFSVLAYRDILRKVADQALDAFVLSNEKEIVYHNKAFEDMLGVKIATGTDIPKALQGSISAAALERLESDRKALYQGSSGKFECTCTLQSSAKKYQVTLRSNRIQGEKRQSSFDLTIISVRNEWLPGENGNSNTRQEQKAILDNIPYLAWLKDAEGRYISVNEPFAGFFNMDHCDIIGKLDEDLFDAQISALFQKYDSSVRIARKRKYFEDEWIVDSNPCWIEAFTAPIVNDEHELIGITGIARDITDRKTMEDTIIKNEEHFRALLQYSSDAITILDKTGNIMFESALRNRISDFLIDELIGKPFEEMVHPEDKGIFRETLKAVLLEPMSQVKREYRSLHKNKRWIYVESIFSNHLNNPSIRGIVVNTRDISDRKMSELKERVYHDNLVFLSNSALELLGLSGRDEIYRYICHKLYEFLEDAVVMVSSYTESTKSCQLEAIYGKFVNQQAINTVLGHEPIGMVYQLDQPEKSIENAGNITIYNGPSEDLNFDPLTRAALGRIIEEIHVNKVYHIAMARDNKLLGNIIILTLNKTIVKFKHIIETFVHQISVALQRSQLEYELVQARDKAEESDKLKTAFLTNMSHEIRTPMNGILGFAEMLNDDQLGEGNRRKYVEIINNNGKILMNLIDDIIDFSKIEAGQIKILQQEFSLNALLTQVHTSFMTNSFLKDKSGVQLRVSKAFSNDKCYIQTDPNRLRQVIINLVGNAMKFTKEGYIEFGYRLSQEDMLEFYVKDTGIGIEEDKIDKIFERFVQADYSRSRKYSGSGLGLAISKGFVELLGGTMWVESKVNAGSTFFFTIPYVPSKLKSAEESDRKRPRSDYNWEGKLFLVAEDDTFSYKLLEGFLKKTNAEVIHAPDGARAVELAREREDIDLILMDVQMPEMNGMEATQAIKQFRKVPIIAQTANAISEERQRCFEAGFDDFVTKPINISELFIKIDQWLQAH